MIRRFENDTLLTWFYLTSSHSLYLIVIVIKFYFSMSLKVMAFYDPRHQTKCSIANTWYETLKSTIEIKVGSNYI